MTIKNRRLTRSRFGFTRVTHCNVLFYCGTKQFFSMELRSWAIIEGNIVRYLKNATAVCILVLISPHFVFQTAAMYNVDTLWLFFCCFEPVRLLCAVKFFLYYFLHIQLQDIFNINDSDVIVVKFIRVCRMDSHQNFLKSIS